MLPLSKEEKEMLLRAFMLRKITLEEAMKLHKQHGYVFQVNDGALVDIEVE